MRDSKGKNPSNSEFFAQQRRIGFSSFAETATCPSTCSTMKPNE